MYVLYSLRYTHAESRQSSSDAPSIHTLEHHAKVSLPLTSLAMST
jgi:hypothetical protein